jgi:hypothetical protein
MAIRQALTELAQCSNPDTSVFIYFSSHGGRLEAGPYAGEYLLPVDTWYTSDQSLAETAISGAEFTTALHAIPTRKVVVVFDCCHAGGIGQPKEVTAPKLKTLPKSYYDALTSGRGRVILASSRSICSLVCAVGPQARAVSSASSTSSITYSPESPAISPVSTRSSKPRWRRTSPSLCTWGVSRLRRCHWPPGGPFRL